MRKFIEKINNMIQWTKKFHFFHIWLGLGFIVALLPIVLTIMTCCVMISSPNDLSDMGRAIGIGLMLFIGLIVISYIATFILAIIIEFIILFIYVCSAKRTSYLVKSHFLLSNKVYANFYNISMFLASIIIGFLFLIIIMNNLGY